MLAWVARAIAPILQSIPTACLAVVPVIACRRHPAPAPQRHLLRRALHRSRGAVGRRRPAAHRPACHVHCCPGSAQRPRNARTCTLEAARGGEAGLESRPAAAFVLALL